ncbi:FLYWCH-type zinc finger-containing protein 1-like [Aphis craccivora]|uniref:FLYWCH-type zinc finger-containing protein 1-like n=1 Tax=Aphis craccivora TaxID=307492 RepID=A0A6G0W2I0_APHCR|nr:FLYWCH-type zinc finger-containing protein 1-like [Aphis craccivora]
MISFATRSLSCSFLRLYLSVRSCAIKCAGQLPNINRIKRTIQRVRKQKLQLPNDPTDLNFIIPDEMTKTIDGNLVLQYDSDINTE